jgi:p-cumate 2,3-dioxygenase beta subunit
MNSFGNLSRAQAEDFLFHEAELLDDWRLNEWAALFTEDSTYEITAPGSADPLASDPATELFLVADRIDRIRGRATRLLKKTAHAEYPRSKTRHCFSNIRVGEQSPDHVSVRANFITHRTKEEQTSVFVGESHYRLTVGDRTPMIRTKRVILDLNNLYAQGRLTIIL